MKVESDTTATPNDEDAPHRFNLRDYLPYHLTILSNHLAAALNKTYGKRWGLSVSEWRVLGILMSDGSMTAVEVATEADLDQVAVHRATSRLLERGLVSREVDAVDKRRKPLNVTQQGEQFYAEIAPFALELQRNLLAPLNENEQTQLWALIRKLSARVEEL
ncbi:winged helix-turn-helix transcriptional regulator [Burkholderia sp. MS455]|uniref:MarR family winged helix-turn-helix transcriptional regulator n=1 Tax=Burkholderia sp. MS455 TaxID=2811788 RepID=UPI00195AC1BA|nr:MarR family winged helix-turn-helix transcriptional regulator [Burkholderia sp. MS455]QRR07529.1 winged helix-turn-helix transcriptional regulator [Burkholderia sp. MS455]